MERSYFEIYIAKVAEKKVISYISICIYIKYNKIHKYNNVFCVISC